MKTPKFANEATTPEAVKHALLHVRIFHPDVTMVVFDMQCRWLYMTDEFEAPNLKDEVDVSILDDAADEVYAVCPLPAVFAIIAEGD